MNMESIFPSTYRFGTGDIVDSNGVRSGQIDIVTEYPFLPSFPALGKDSPRLYLADGVAIVIEVKSNLCDQWDEVIATCNKLKKLSCDESRITQAIGSTPGTKIPLIAVGFKGWKKKETIEETLDSSNVDAILSIEEKIFGNKAVVNKSDKTQIIIEKAVHEGNISLWEFAKFFYKRVGSVATMYLDIDSY